MTSSNPTNAAHNNVNAGAGLGRNAAGFSPDRLRQVMGPGYQIALFREGSTMTGTGPAARPVRSAPARRRSAPRRPRSPWGGLRLPLVIRSFRPVVGRVAPEVIAPQAI